MEFGGADCIFAQTYKSKVKDAAPRAGFDVVVRAWDGGGGKALSSHAGSQLRPEISPVAPSSHELFSYFLEGNIREQKIVFLSCIMMAHLILFSKSVQLPLEN